MRRAIVLLTAIGLLLGVMSPASAGRPDETFLGIQDPQGNYHLRVITPNVDDDGNCQYRAEPELTGLQGRYTLELVVTATQETPAREVSRQTWDILGRDTDEVWQFVADWVTVPQSSGEVQFELSLNRGRGPHTVATQQDTSTACFDQP